jgi:hypothetical protein
MNLQRRRPFNRTLMIGLAFMAVASVVRLLLERHSSIPEGPRDGAVGLLYGLAIGCTLLGVWRMRHASASSDKQRCA